MASYGLDSKINEPTRVTANSQTLIDHVFERHRLSVDPEMEVWVADTDVTDHRATVLCVNCLHTASQTKTVSHPYKINYDKLNNLLSHMDWKDVFLSRNSVSDSFNKFITILNLCINQSRSLKTKWDKKRKKLKPWMTNSLLRMVNRKNFLYTNSKKEPHNETKKAEYTSFKNMLVNRLRMVKNEYYSSALIENKNNPRNQWNVVNELIGRNKTKLDVILKDNDGNIIQDRNIVAGMFNEFFCTVADKLRLDISRDRNTLISSMA